MAMETSSAVVTSFPPHTKTFFERSRGALAVAILVPFAALAMLSEPPAWSGPLTTLVIHAVGWITFLAGAGLRLWATLYIGGRKGKLLTTEGPYSICRNPLYLGSFLLTLSMAFYLESLTFAAGLMLVLPLYLITTIASEENRLRERLGETFDAYCRTVPRLWPRLSSFHTSPTISVDTRCLWIECQRALRWMWIPLFCEALNMLRALPAWPHWVSLP